MPGRSAPSPPSRRWRDPRASRRRAVPALARWAGAASRRAPCRRAWRHAVTAPSARSRRRSSRATPRHRRGRGVLRAGWRGRLRPDRDVRRLSVERVPEREETAAFGTSMRERVGVGRRAEKLRERLGARGIGEVPYDGRGVLRKAADEAVARVLEVARLVPLRVEPAEEFPCAILGNPHPGLQPRAAHCIRRFGGTVTTVPSGARRSGRPRHAVLPRGTSRSGRSGRPGDAPALKRGDLPLEFGHPLRARLLLAPCDSGRGEAGERDTQRDQHAAPHGWRLYAATPRPCQASMRASEAAGEPASRTRRCRTGARDGARGPSRSRDCLGARARRPSRAAAAREAWRPKMPAYGSRARARSGERSSVPSSARSAGVRAMPSSFVPHNPPRARSTTSATRRARRAWSTGVSSELPN